jgi:ferrochelatase
MGGPANEHEIAGYLRRLLSDPEIMPLPWPLRTLLARRIARRRAPHTAEHYRAIGGASPIADETRVQAEALARELGSGFRVRYAFRYSEPGAEQVTASLAHEGVRRLVALPAYPQWSRTTSGSATDDLGRAARKAGLDLTVARSYPQGPGFVDALWDQAGALLADSTHVVFSAHGLPLRIVRAGDPYVDEIEKTVAALAARLPADTPYSLAFQSRMGMAEWTRPYLADEIQRLGQDGVNAVLVVPVSFACENLETLYELDIEIAALARRCGILAYRRAPAPGCHVGFIAELARVARDAVRGAGWEEPDA